MKPTKEEVQRLVKEAVSAISTLSIEGYSTDANNLEAALEPFRNWEEEKTGLSEEQEKERRLFAAMILQGFGPHFGDDRATRCSIAIEHADELIKQLNYEKR